MNTQTPPRYASMGQLVQWLQVGPREIERGLAKIGVTPSLVLNGTPYFDESIVTRLAGIIGSKERTR